MKSNKLNKISFDKVIVLSCIENQLQINKMGFLEKYFPKFHNQYKFNILNEKNIIERRRKCLLERLFIQKKENDTQMIKMFIKNVQQRCENILKWSLKIGLQESKDGIIQEIKWFQLSSQYLNQISRQTQMVQENIQLVFINLEILLQAILNMVQSQSFLSYHLLKICNLFSQQIFIYYIYSPNPPIKQEKQNNYQNLLAEIEKYIEFGGQNFYQNSIIYEFEVIKMCINICPNDSTKGQEILMNTFKGILESATKMSPSTELVTALLDGAVYVYQKIKQYNQKKIFQVIFYLEQLKWAIIEKIQNGISINSIMQSLAENYKKLINQQNQWIIKCSWIKFISEILQYTPIITKEKYQKIKSSYKLNRDWIQLIESKVINAIDENQNIGIISNTDSGDQVSRIFKTQFIVLDQLKNICLNGDQDIPKFDIFVKEQQIEVSQGEKQEQFVKILEYIDNLQISQLQNMFKSFQQNLLEYLRTSNSLLEDQLDIIQQQCQVQKQIIQTYQLDSQLQNLILNGTIINKQLECFIDTSENHLENAQVDQYLFYSLLQNYFVVIQNIGNKNQDILENYQEFVKSYPEIQLKEVIKAQFQKNLFEDLINQSQIKELIPIISLLNEKIYRIEQQKIKSFQKIQYYKGLLNQFVTVLIEFRKDLRKQQNKFFFLEQTIIATNQLAKDNNSQNIKEYYVYFAIIQQIIQIYEEINDLLSDLNLSEQEIKDFKFFNNAEIVSIFNAAIESEIQYLSNQQNVEQYLNSQENQSTEKQLQLMLIILQTQKQIQERKNEEVQIFINKIQVYKSIFYNNLEIQSNQEQSYSNLLIQSVLSLKQLIEKGNQRQDLINILEQRRNLLLKLQSEQKDNQILYNQIQKEILYTQIVNQEQFYEFIEKKKEAFVSNLNQSNQIIINCLQQTEENQTSDNNKKILQFIEILDKLSDQIDLSIKTKSGTELAQKRQLWSINLQKQQLYEDNQQYQQLYISLSNPIDNLTITSDNLYLAISDYGVLYIYDAETFFLLSVPHEGHYNEITSIGFDTKQKELITSSNDFTVRLWDFKILLQKSVQNQSEKFNKISTIQYSPDGMLIYYCLSQKTCLFIVSVQTGEQTDQINFQFKDFNVCITGRYIYFIDTKKSFVQYDINTKTFSEMVSLHQVYDIDTIQQSQNYRLFQLVDSAGGREYHAHSYIVLLNDKAQFQSIIRMEFTLQIQFSHNTNYLYYLSYRESKTIKTMQISIQDIEDKFLKKLDNPQFKHSDSIHSFVLKSDDKQIISFYTSLDETKLFVWDIQSKELHLQLDFGCWGFIRSKTLNQYLILFNRNKIFFYETETYQQVGSSSNINYDMIACCPNRYQFITIEGKNSIKLWNIDKEKLSQNIYVFNEGLVIPNYSMQGTLLDNVKWDNSKIISHLKFDLQNIWQQK